MDVENRSWGAALEGSPETEEAVRRLDTSPHIPVSGPGSRDESVPDREARFETREAIVSLADKVRDEIAKHPSWKDDPQTVNALGELYRTLAAMRDEYQDPATQNRGLTMFENPRKHYSLDSEPSSVLVE